MRKLDRDFEHHIVHNLRGELSMSVNGHYVYDDLEAKSQLWQAAQEAFEKKVEKYKEFFDIAWKDYCKGELDFETGVYIQEAAEKAGLVEEVPYNPDIHGHVEDTEVGDMIYVRKDK